MIDLLSNLINVIPPQSVYKNHCFYCKSLQVFEWLAVYPQMAIKIKPLILLNL